MVVTGGGTIATRKIEDLLESTDVEGAWLVIWSELVPAGRTTEVEDLLAQGAGQSGRTRLCSRRRPGFGRFRCKTPPEPEC